MQAMFQSREISPECLRNVDLLRLLRNYVAFGVGASENQESRDL